MSSAEMLADDAHFALEKFGHKNLQKRAKGILVFPSVVKAGFGFGGSYGEGVLLENEEPVDFFNIISASFGWQMGIQKRTVLMFFMTDYALEEFKNSSGFKLGADASFSVLMLDGGAELNLDEITSPVLVIVTDREGLMYNLSLEGSKISRIAK